MNMTLPSESDLKQALPQMENIALLDMGGFKAVYRVTLGGRARG